MFSDLTTVAEMDETVSGVTTRGRHTELYLVAGAGAGAGAGVGAGVGAGGSVRYSELTTEHKGDVLADLLTKTAISHALDRHQQVRGQRGLTGTQKHFGAKTPSSKLRQVFCIKFFFII